jgi:hypothetical protein
MIYLDRQRCEEGGIAYDEEAIQGTLSCVSFAARHQDIEGLDQTSRRLSLQVAAYLESQYEKAGVISNGEGR